jgi:hypothetical protein
MINAFKSWLYIEMFMINAFKSSCTLTKLESRRTDATAKRVLKLNDRWQLKQFGFKFLNILLYNYKNG